MAEFCKLITEIWAQLLELFSAITLLVTQLLVRDYEICTHPRTQ